MTGAGGGSGEPVVGRSATEPAVRGMMVAHPWHVPARQPGHPAADLGERAPASLDPNQDHLSGALAAVDAHRAGRPTDQAGLVGALILVAAAALDALDPLDADVLLTHLHRRAGHPRWPR